MPFQKSKIVPIANYWMAIKINTATYARESPQCSAWLSPLWIIRVQCIGWGLVLLCTRCKTHRFNVLLRGRGNQHCGFQVPMTLNFSPNFSSGYPILNFSGDSIFQAFVGKPFQALVGNPWSKHPPKIGWIGIKYVLCIPNEDALFVIASSQCNTKE